MIGKTVAHYRIDRELGRGGMGAVYRAFDQKLRRDVALKVLQDKVIGREDQRRRLLSEARAASPLNHPGIATIYEVGQQDDLLFIVMELVEGMTLREASGAQPMRPRSLVRTGAQVAEALEAAHSHSVIHGDIKPENIVIQRDNRVKLLDFGIARQFSSEAVTATVTGQDLKILSGGEVAGTLAYMAPERFEGKSLDPRSDLYSLGVLLYEMAVGSLPFPGPDAASLVGQILHQTAPRLDSGNNAIPTELARIVHKLLEKDPQLRYQTASQVKVDLKGLERDLELGPALSAAVAGRRTVAVLPFSLLTPNREDEFLSLALAEAVINGLSASDVLLLRPLSAVLRYAKERADPMVAARELNVDVIVEGSIQKLGPQMRVHVQVWKAEDGSTLLSAKHDADVSGLFQLQDRIAEGLFNALGVTIVGQEVPPTENPQAYELFLRAVERLSHGNRWDTQTAVEMLKQVTELDPRFAEAWARLGQACVMMGFAFDPESSWFDLAEEAIERTLALDPTNVQARVVRGRVLWSPDRGFQNGPALKALGEALKLNPNSHQALVWHSLVFLHVGLLREAHAGLTEALSIQPDDAFTLNFLGQVLEFMGDYDEAERYHSRALSIDPSHIFANLFHPTALVHRGQLERAEQCIRDAKKLLGDDKMLISTEAIIWARRGEGEKAASLVKSALEEGRTRAHTHHTWHHAAAALALIDRPAEAVELLGKAARTGLPNYPLFRDDPHLVSLREHSGFQRLMSTVQQECEAYRGEFVA